jgi:hypothetical protein
MSLKLTEEFYKGVINQVVKEIGDDPQLNGLSSQAVDYLLAVTFFYRPHSKELETKACRN